MTTSRLEPIGRLKFLAAAAMITAHAALAATTATLTGCGYGGSWSGWSSGSHVELAVRADRIDDLRSRVVTHEIAAGEGRVVRVGNLAGTVRLAHGDVSSVEIEATVYAQAGDDERTAALLDEMTWIRGADRDGRPEWTLSWPVDRHRELHYSTEREGFAVTTTWDGTRGVTVTTRKRPGTPTLFADLLITYPAGTVLSCRNVGGPIDGGDLSGELVVDTTAGAVTLGSFHGELTADTGCGDIRIDRTDGHARLDTGSGDILVRTARGSVHLDTGSGDVEVGDLEGDAHMDTGSGDIVIDHMTGADLYADTGSGDIVVRSGVVDSVRADTGSGNVDLLGVEFGRFHGDTGSGDITIHSSLGEADRVHADTGSGDVTIVTDDGASFDLRVGTGSGRMRIDFDDARLRYDDHRIVGARRGAGHTRIHVSTGSGDCTIRPAG